MFDKIGKPYTDVKWPMVARFKVTGDNDPLRWDYETKKDARMRDRAARFQEANGEELPAKASGPLPVNMALVELAQRELKKYSAQVPPAPLPAPLA